MKVWRAEAWEGERDLAVERAFRSVPFYREQWAAAGRRLDEPVPVRAQDLAEQSYRLCPVARQWRPDREPSLWTGDPGALADALAVAGVETSRTPVLEVRPAMVDWERLAPRSGPYGVILAPGADVPAERRSGLHERAVGLLRAHGGGVLVAGPSELAVRPELDGAYGTAPAQLSIVHRLTAGAVHRGVPATLGDRPYVVHDPFLGYLAARAPYCGMVHVLWERVHCRATVDGPLFTHLRSRRPTLVNVLPVDHGYASVGSCRVHGTPVLTG